LPAAGALRAEIHRDAQTATERVDTRRPGPYERARLSLVRDIPRYRDALAERSFGRVCDGSHAAFGVQRTIRCVLSLRLAARVTVGVGGPALLLGVLARPLLFTNAQDWLGHLWLLWHQSLTIRATHLPSLFIHYSHSVFYPEYAFYGGTLYALGGILSLLLGNAPLQAYIATYCLGFLMAYCGWYWISRMAGLGRWQAHAPGLIFITSASYLTIIYGRGDWPEFMAVSTIPLMSAAGLSVLRSDRLQLRPALTLAGTGVVFFGSHGMTLLWGTTFLGLVGLAIVVCVPQTRGQITRRRAIHVASLVVPALLVSAWFLLPELAYASRTYAGSGYLEGSHFWESTLHRFMFFASVKYLFTIERVSVEGSTYFLTLPVLAIAWILLTTGVLLRTRLRGPWMRILLILIGVSILFALVMTHAGLILALPLPYTILEFSYRLESYVLLGVSGAALAALVLAKQSDARRIRLWTWTLLPVLAASVIGAVQQLDESPHEAGRKGVLRSYFKPVLPNGAQLRGLRDFYDVELPRVAPRSKSVRVYFPPAGVHGDRTSTVVRLPPGQLLSTNIASGPELVHVTGARIVGLNEEGNDLLEISPNASAAAQINPSKAVERISLSPAHPLPVILGRVLSLIGAIALAARLMMLAIARRRSASG
jgi:hypothetical protein